MSKDKPVLVLIPINFSIFWSYVIEKLQNLMVQKDASNVDENALVVEIGIRLQKLH